MSEMVQRLRERRAQVWEQMKGIADRSTEENRNLTAEEQGQWDVMSEELDKLDARIKSALDTEQRAKDADAAFERLNGKGSSQRASNGGGQVERRGEQPPAGGGDRSEELRSFLRGERGRFYDVNPEGPVDYRTLVKGTSTAGGNTVPTGFYDRLITHLIEVSAIMQAGATILNTNSGEIIQVPKTTAHSSAAIVTEGNAISTSDPAFGQVPLGAYKYGTMIQVSRELLDDTGVDLEGYLAMQAGRALGNAFGAHAISGTGTSQPRGVLTDATLGVTGQSGVGGVFSGDNMIDLFYSVIAPYRASASCKWIMRDATVGAARKLKDQMGQYIWQPSLQAGAPDLLLGKPVLTDPNVPGVGTANKSALFGDFSQFFVRFAGGVRFERSDDYAFNTDLVTFRALLRADCSLVDLTGAVKYFQGNAA
ncbi:phage major capsid protein [Streptomyces sp. NPDC007251]|uniref:phage major capsid protein n=1 Tax=Streptomyces sp. NPDC007251 TaxID=3154483 RepID=UPI0033FF6F0A